MITNYVLKYTKKKKMENLYVAICKYYNCAQKDLFIIDCGEINYGIVLMRNCETYLDKINNSCSSFDSKDMEFFSNELSRCNDEFISWLKSLSGGQSSLNIRLRHFLTPSPTDLGEEFEKMEISWGHPNSLDERYVVTYKLDDCGFDSTDEPDPKTDVMTLQIGGGGKIYGCVGDICAILEKLVKPGDILTRKITYGDFHSHVEQHSSSSWSCQYSCHHIVDKMCV